MSAVDVKGQSSTLVQIQEEEEEEDTNKQPAAKRKKGQSRSQTKCEEMSKEEIKSEGNLDLSFTSFVLIKHVTNVRWDEKQLLTHNTFTAYVGLQIAMYCIT